MSGSSKLWGGRFTGTVDELTERLNNSLPFDQRMWKQDIRGSIAHATMLGEQEIIPSHEAATIVAGLRKILSDLENGSLELDPSQEDIHSAAESLLYQTIGPIAGKLHTARSRNDQVATDFRLYILDSVDEIDLWLKALQQTIINVSERELDVIVSGYTHLQHAQPVLLSHHLMAYFWMLQRDRERLNDLSKRLNYLPLGSGALAGTTFNIDRHRVAELLGFSGVIENSIDAVSDRDFALEFLSFASILMVHISRIAEEIIIWNSTEFGYIDLDDSVTTGSSIMPQKKNPDVAELGRGKAGRVFGNLMSLLTVMKGLPLSYNKDSQEDKEPVFDTIDTLLVILPPFEKMLSSAKFRSEKMKASLYQDFSTATELADYLATQGMPFREAHHIVGDIVKYCLGAGIGLEDIPNGKLQEFSSLFPSDTTSIIAIETSVDRRNSYGGTSQTSVLHQIQKAKNILQ